jgi:histone acetyltransferase (RNA polymerase elongator complex component)
MNSANEMTFCPDHGCPVGFCRWCADGTEPIAAESLTEAERLAKRVAIRADWDKQLAALPAARAKSRSSRKGAR